MREALNKKRKVKKESETIKEVFRKAKDIVKVLEKEAE